MGKGLLPGFDNERARHEIDEELQLHIDLLTQEHLQANLPFETARDAALKRFGNPEDIQKQCLEISRRRHPAVRALKLFLILIFLTGVLVRIFAPEYHVTRMGDVLMAVGLLGRLWVYLRVLAPSAFFSKPEVSSSLRLIDVSPTAIDSYDREKRTPVERVIFDK